MKIEEIVSQNRRDFIAIYICEHCGHTMKRGGYDDTNFHNNVVPSMKCPKCGCTAAENYRLLATKYRDSAII